MNPADFKEKPLFLDMTTVFSKIFCSLLKTNISTIEDLKYEETYNLDGFEFDADLFEPFVANITSVGLNPITLTQWHKILLSKESDSKVTMKLHAGVFGDGKFFDSVIYLTLEESNGKVNTTIQFYSQNPEAPGGTSVLGENDNLQYTMYDYESFLNTSAGMEGISNYCGFTKTKTTTKENALLTYLTEGPNVKKSVQKSGMTYSSDGIVVDSTFGTVSVGGLYNLSVLDFKGTLNTSVEELNTSTLNSAEITITLEGEDPVSIKNFFKVVDGATGSKCILVELAEGYEKYFTVNSKVEAKIAACKAIMDKEDNWTDLKTDVEAIDGLPNDEAVQQELVTWLKAILAE